MMDTQCTELRRAWSACLASDYETRRAELSRELQTHLGGCRPCAALLEGEARAMDGWRVSTEAASHAPLPAFARVAGAVSERERAKTMKLRRLWTRLAIGVPLVAAAVIATFVVSAPREAEPQANTSSAVISAVGAVSLERRGAWESVNRGTTLMVGDRVETGATASLHLVRPGVAELRISEKSELHIQAWADNAISLRLDRGEILSSVEHRGPGDVYEIFTPDAVITVVGTRFVARYQPEEGTTVIGIEGVVRVTDRLGRLIDDVHAGQTVRTRGQSAAGANSALPEAPDTLHNHLNKITSPDRPPAPARVAEAEAEAATKDLQAPGAPTAHPSDGATPSQRAPSTATDRAAPTSIERRPNATRLPRDKPHPGAEAGSGSIARSADPVEGPAAPAADAPVSRRATLRAEADGLVLAGAFARAARTYVEAMTAEGSDPGGLVIDAGQSLVKADDTSGALAIWQDYLDRYPRGQAAGAVAGRLARHRAAAGDWSEAERLWRMVLAHDAGSPEGARALEALGKHHIAHGRFADAAALFSPLATATGANGEVALFGLILAREAERSWPEVRRLTEAYIRRYPNAPRRTAVDGIAARLPALGHP